MRYDDIVALDVPSLAAQDCVLWLWVVNPLLGKGLDLAARWGFECKSLLTWSKTQKDMRTPFIGTGYWLRGATEHALLAVRGKPKPLLKAQPTWFAAPVSEHSRKPSVAYEIFERYYEGPRIDLFARQTRPGWATWGNDVQEAPLSLFDAATDAVPTAPAS